jgi:hypothetical protein
MQHVLENSEMHYKILSDDLKGRSRCRLEYNIKRYMIRDCGWALSGSG